MSVNLKLALSGMLVALGLYGAYTIGRVMQRARELSSPASESESDADRAAPPARRELPDLTDYALTERSGEQFSFADLKGRVWVASFFFTACPGPCAEMNRLVAQLQQNPEYSQVKFISITCDPDNDTTDRLATYARSFNADPEQWLFLTGEFDQIQRLGNEIFAVTVGSKEHSDRLILVDAEGYVRGTYRSRDPAQAAFFERKLRQVLEEQASQTESAPAGEAAADDAPLADPPEAAPPAAATEEESRPDEAAAEVQPSAAESGSANDAPAADAAPAAGAAP